MKKINWTNIFLSLLGLFMFSYYIWLRFIRVRLPKDIPFNLTIIGFFLLVYICCIYLYIIISLCSKDNELKESKLLKIAYYFFLPLKTLDKSIKRNKVIKPMYERIIDYFVIFLDKKITFDAYSIWVYYLCQIFILYPRYILLSVLLIDVFYFNRLEYIYFLIPLSAIFLLRRYIKYSIKLYIEEYTEIAKSLADGMITNCILPKDLEEEDYDPDSAVFRTIDEFIDTQVHNLSYYYKEYHELYLFTLKKGEYALLKDQGEPYCRNMINNVIRLSIFLRKWSIIEDYYKFDWIRVIIFSLYLLCWSYILILSIGKKELTYMILIYISKYVENIEPFSGLFL